MRIIACYTISDRLKYISHLDLQRTMQRALRRAEIPVAFSEGFNPHPRLSFASPLSVGVTSTGEYMDIRLQEAMEINEFITRLNEGLPQGIKITDAEAIDNSIPSLMSLVEMARYRVVLSKPVDNLEQKIREFAKQEYVEYEKQTKKKKRIINIMEGIIDIKVDNDSENSFILCLSVGGKNSIKPEVITEFLLKFVGYDAVDSMQFKVNREGLYTKQDEQWITILNYCRGLN